ncbi:hypothetical protein H257_15363 [Aphanomyces astaci]|uniref:Uncharacterized protein n=1 Tax=Aphanomyces astaci TaxID=112090 RepID=W4FQ37_APHAT|nr:hypothetical protein H257_15363 [Aphanomyces astaci]ETV68803.1 hypothetical protein H257_15363 [Aphanomyces astaci]|eukprot:XP_009841757.1 hypothetical protein H257_15363 [Aphanomyces astaci]
MPKYTNVARTFRQPPIESAPPTPRRRQGREAHQTHEEPFIDDIDSQIHQGTDPVRILETDLYLWKS